MTWIEWTAHFLFLFFFTILKFRLIIVPFKIEILFHFIVFLVYVYKLSRNFLFWIDFINFTCLASIIKCIFLSFWVCTLIILPITYNFKIIESLLDFRLSFLFIFLHLKMNRISHRLSCSRILWLNWNLMLFMSAFLLAYVLSWRSCCVLNLFVDINLQKVNIILSFTIFCILYIHFAFKRYV